jgi:hypothetical protein
MAVGSGQSMVSGPLLVTTAPWPDSSMVALATMPQGSGGSLVADDAIVVTRAIAEKEVTVKKVTNDAVVVKKAADEVAAVMKATDDVTAVKKAADDATVVKKATDDVAAAKKVADDAAAVKKATNEAVVAKKAVEDAIAMKKATGHAVTAGSDSSLAPSVGAKRAAAPSDSTPLAMRRFLNSWKPRYVAQTFICHFLYCIYDFDFVLLTYSVSSSSRSPPSRGQALWVHPKLADPRTPLRLMVPRDRLLGLLVATGSWSPV